MTGSEFGESSRGSLQRVLGAYPPYLAYLTDPTYLASQGMALACGIDYDNAAADAVTITIGGVAITVASPATLIRTKNTMRPSDAADRQYLEELVRAEGGEP